MPKEFEYVPYSTLPCARCKGPLPTPLSGEPLYVVPVQGFGGWAYMACCNEDCAGEVGRNVGEYCRRLAYWLIPHDSGVREQARIGREIVNVRGMKILELAAKPPVFSIA